MNIKTLIISAILGTSSVAVAEPFTYNATANISWNAHAHVGGPVIRDHRNDRFVRQPIRVTRPLRLHRGHVDNFNPRGEDWGYQDRGLVLASGLTFNYSDYRKDVIVGAGAGYLQRLQIVPDFGRTYIVKVAIEFTDGYVQTVRVDRSISGGRALDIDLDGNGRKVQRIFVYRAEGAAANYINARHRGSFSVLAL